MILTNITSKIRALVVIGAVVIPLAIPAVGLAQTLTLAKARSVAAAQAKVIKSQTAAQSSTVTSCARQTALKVTCKVHSHYSSGLSNCITPVIVYYKSRSATKPRTAIGNSVCS